MYEEGFIARTELLHAKVAQAQADREFKASRRDLKLAHTSPGQPSGIRRSVSPPHDPAFSGLRTGTRG